MNILVYICSTCYILIYLAIQIYKMGDPATDTLLAYCTHCKTTKKIVFQNCMEMLERHNFDKYQKICMVFDAAGLAQCETECLIEILKKFRDLLTGKNSTTGEQKDIRVYFSDPTYHNEKNIPLNGYVKLLPKHIKIIWSTGNEHLLEMISNTYLEGYKIMYNVFFSERAYNFDRIDVHNICTSLCLPYGINLDGRTLKRNEYCADYDQSIVKKNMHVDDIINIILSHDNISEAIDVIIDKTRKKIGVSP